MKRQLFSLLFIVWAVLQTAAAQTGEVTISGEIVDLVSYMASGVKADSPGNMEIVQASAKGGNPLGVLEDGSGRLYVVTMKQANTGPNQSLLPWVGSRIVAKGKVYSKGSTSVLVLTTIGKAAK